MPPEEIDAFHRSINDCVTEIETILLSSDSGTPSAINAMVQQITNAKSQLSAASDILPSFDIDKAQSTITAYENKIQEKRAGAGKKKFSFKKTTTVKSTATASKPATTTPSNPNTSTSTSETRPTAAAADIDEEIDPNRSVQKLSNETIVIDAERLLATEGPIQGLPGDFSLYKLSNCEVRLHGLTTALRLSHLTSCRIICAPTNGSIFVQHCKDITLISASRQIRIHDTFDSTFCIYTQSRPTIEHCKGLKFAPYNATHENMEQWLLKCEFALERNEWNDVQDFNWLRANSPNWSAVPLEERQIVPL